MSQVTETKQPRQNTAVIILLFALFLLILFVAWQLWPGVQSRPLKPVYPTITPISATFNGQPVPISFPDLQANPASYLGQRIRVTGDFTRIAPPDCRSASGPLIRWGLVASELQMNGVGMESIIRLVPDGTTMTIQGIWRRYQGPIGCGKEPEVQTVWYLAIEHILQPNPLPDFGTSRPTTPPVGDGTPLPAETAVSDENGTPLPVQTTVMTITPTTTPTLLSTITATSTPSTTPTISGTFETTTPTPTVNGTAVLTNTPPPNSTATSTSITPIATQPPSAPTPTSGLQPPPLSSATPDPYPVNTPIPTDIPSYP
jgi:hypothetical protein